MDHNLGTVVTDAFVMDDNLDHVLRHWHVADGSGGSEDPDPPLAQARGRLAEAIESGARTSPSLGSETWPRCRPLVEWLVSMMPPGCTGYERPQWSAEDLADLTDRFARSPHAADLSEGEVGLADLFIDLATKHGPGDPLRRSPTSVELLLEWRPATVHAAPASLGAAPEVLRAVVLFSHAERGVARDLPAQTLGSIEAHATGFYQNIGSDEGGPAGRSAERTRRMQETALRRQVPRRGFPHAGQVGARAEAEVSRRFVEPESTTVSQLCPRGRVRWRSIDCQVDCRSSRVIGARPLRVQVAMAVRGALAQVPAAYGRFWFWGAYRLLQ